MSTFPYLEGENKVKAICLAKVGPRLRPARGYGGGMGYVALWWDRLVKKAVRQGDN